METCVTFGCNNLRDHNRRICNQCRNRQRGEAAKRARAVKPKEKKLRQYYGPCTPACPGWRECNSQRLWAQVEPLPCETMLDDEIGVEYDTNELTLWVMPLQVKVSLEIVE